MTKKSLGMLAAILPLALFAEGGGMFAQGSKPSVTVDNTSGELPDMPVPAGCSKYYFDKSGYYDTNRSRINAAFQCIALTEKSAIKKFDKWQQSQKLIESQSTPGTTLTA